MKARASIDIPRSPAEVFAFVSDVATMPAWISGVRNAHLTSPEMGLDAQFVLEYDSGWRPHEVQVVVNEYDPPTVFGLVAERGPFSFEGRIELVPEAGGSTRITNVIEAGPDSLSTRIAAMLLGPFLKGSMNRRLLRELEALRASIDEESQLRP